MAVAGTPEDLAVDVILAVHQLAAITVRHGGGRGRLLMCAADGALHCEVSDTGRGALASAAGARPMDRARSRRRG